MGKLKGHIAYGAGPIDKCPNQGKTWRKEIGEFLHSLDIGWMNPCDKPILNSEYSEDKNLVEKINNLKSEGRYDETSKIVKKIVRSDLTLLDRSDFLITYINTEIHMCGTYTEVTYASIEHKPIIVCCEQGKKNVPNWLWGLCNHELFFDNWIDVKEYIKMVDSNGIHEQYWKFINYDKVFAR